MTVHATVIFVKFPQQSTAGVEAPLRADREARNAPSAAPFSLACAICNDTYPL